MVRWTSATTRKKIYTYAGLVDYFDEAMEAKLIEAQNRIAELEQQVASLQRVNELEKNLEELTRMVEKLRNKEE